MGHQLSRFYRSANRVAREHPLLLAAIPLLLSGTLGKLLLWFTAALVFLLIWSERGFLAFGSIAGVLVLAWSLNLRRIVVDIRRVGLTPASVWRYGPVALGINAAGEVVGVAVIVLAPGGGFATTTGWLRLVLAIVATILVAAGIGRFVERLWPSPFPWKWQNVPTR